MNIGEAMLFVEYLAREGYKDKRFKKESSRKQLMEVIDLLQRGEKFEKMWEEIYKIWFDYKADCYWLDDKGFLSVLPILEYIHDKYFPKGELK